MNFRILLSPCSIFESLTKLGRQVTRLINDGGFSSTTHQFFFFLRSVFCLRGLGSLPRAPSLSGFDDLRCIFLNRCLLYNPVNKNYQNILNTPTSPIPFSLSRSSSRSNCFSLSSLEIAFSNIFLKASR